MPSANAVIVNRLGLHARPSAKLTQTAGQFVESADGKFDRDASVRYSRAST